MSDAELIRERLGSNERLLWVGRPSARICVGLPIRWFLIVSPIILFALAMVGVVLIVLMVQGHPAGFLGGFIFAIFTYAIAVERMIDAWRRRGTIYGLSDKRAVVIAGIISRQVRMLPLDSIGELIVKEHAAGIGTIACISGLNSWHRVNKRGETKPVPLFRLIVDVRHVRDLLVSVRRGGPPITVTCLP